MKKVDLKLSLLNSLREIGLPEQSLKQAMSAKKQVEKATKPNGKVLMSSRSYGSVDNSGDES